MKSISLLLSLAFSTPLIAADPFYWGAGHAAFQVEGSPQPSDWSEWTHTPGKITDGTNADKATEFWTNPEKDFAHCKELGCEMFRMSIAWERVQPARGQWDEEALARYERMIVQLREHGMEPMLTLHHFVLPAWIAKEGGLTSPLFASDFTIFAEKVVNRLARPPANVRWWMTFNEPMIVAYSSYVVGEWPPGKKDDLKSAMRSAANMAKAHLTAMRQLTPIRQELGLKFSVAAHLRDFQGIEGTWYNRVLAAMSDWAFNRQFLNAITTGRIFFWTPGSELIWQKEEMPADGKSLDYLGVNYYGRTMVGFKKEAPYLEVKEGPGIKSDIGWEVYPEGLGNVLRDAYKAYGLPLLVSENGVADAADKLRAEYLRTHTRQILDLRESGVPVLGYLVWALTDNFEWAKGFFPRFGLVEYDPATGARMPRPSFEVYKEIIRANP